MIRFSAYLNRAKMPIFTVGNIVYKSGKSEVLRPLWGGGCVTGSKGSEGSEGSEGGGIAFDDEFYSQRYGIYFMSPVLHDEE